MCLPIPDLKDPVNALFGIFKRVACEPPPYKYPKGRKHFKRYVDRFMHKIGLQRLRPHEVKGMEPWLKTTSYNERRKQRLRDAADDIENLNAVDELKTVKSHNKQEFYTERKPNRFINARTDKAKAAIGPIFEAIGRKVNGLKWFVKHIPFLERPKALQSVLFRKLKYVITDYTSFESHFTKELMETVEFRLYYFMVRDLPDREMYLDYFNEVLAGDFELKYKFF
jgi:hypothetical protein